MRPKPADRVRVNYRGTLLDGTEFDSSYERGQPREFALSQVIAGWSEGLSMMPVGGKYRFWIPGDLAYGAKGMPGGQHRPERDAGVRCRTARRRAVTRIVVAFPLQPALRVCLDFRFPRSANDEAFPAPRTRPHPRRRRGSSPPAATAGREETDANAPAAASTAKGAAADRRPADREGPGQLHGRHGAGQAARADEGRNRRRHHRQGDQDLARRARSC